MTNLKTLKTKAFKNEKVKKAYDLLETEFLVALSLTELRATEDLTNDIPVDG